MWFAQEKRDVVLALDHRAQKIFFCLSVPNCSGFATYGNEMPPI